MVVKLEITQSHLCDTCVTPGRTGLQRAFVGSELQLFLLSLHRWKASSRTSRTSGQVSARDPSPEPPAPQGVAHGCILMMRLAPYL